MSVDAYALLARNYDLLMQDIPYQRWIDFIAAYAGKMGKSDLRIVDVGCGTGTVALGLRQRGFWLAGLDSSSEMLSLARMKADRLNLTLPLLQGDFSDLQLTADLVISTCDGINHLLGCRDIIKFFRRAHACLSPRGCLLFDINTEYKFRRVLADNVFAWSIEDLDLVWRNQYAAPFNYAAIAMYTSLGKGRWSKANFCIKQRCHQVSSLIYYLEQTGFRLEGLWENYGSRRITPTAQRITFAAQKR